MSVTVFRRCEDCGVSIEDRPVRAYLCLPCFAFRKRLHGRQWAARERAANPERVHANYKRWYDTLPKPMRTCATEGCNNTFPSGHGRTFCRDCAGFFHGPAYGAGRAA